MQSLDISPLLPFVEKPGRYLGIECNSIRKNWNTTDVKVALCFPDLYELGMSNLGLGIIYSVINERNDSLAERVYAPGPDMEKILRSKKIPLFSLESKAPLKDFDIIGFTLQYELSYTNVLNMLDLGGIPLKASERNESYPLVIAGGPCASNPEPLSDFIDAFVLGDGEEVAGRVMDEYGAWKKSGAKKERLLESLAKLSGVYVPSLYEVQYNADGTIKSVKPARADVPPTVKKSVVKLTAYPVKPVVPLVGSVHDRFTLEIQRGCPHKCRFCQARVVYCPLRVRDKEALVSIASEGIKNTGYDEVSLSSLSSMDYPDIKGLVAGLYEKFRGQEVSLSVSSLRPDRGSLEVASMVQRVRKAGLTFAPESGSKRMRKVLGKEFDENDFLAAVDSACSSGWRLIKLYFMVGLPGETEKDMEETVEFVKNIKRQHRNLNFNITISSLVPKPHTPFEWLGRDETDSLKTRMEYLSRRLPGNVRYHDVRSSLLEAVFARGDRRLGNVLESALRAGCKFDQWREHFRFDLWEKAFSESGISMAFYALRKRGEEEIFPWDHLDYGVKKEVLLSEFREAMTDAGTENKD